MCASQSLVKGSTVAHTNATRNTFSGELHGKKYETTQSGLGIESMNLSPKIEQPRRVGTADATTRPKMNMLSQDIKPVMMKTQSGISVHDIVNAKIGKQLFGIDSYYIPVRDTSKIKPWQAW